MRILFTEDNNTCTHLVYKWVPLKNLSPDTHSSQICKIEDCEVESASGLPLAVKEVHMDGVTGLDSFEGLNEGIHTLMVRNSEIKNLTGLPSTLTKLKLNYCKLGQNGSLSLPQSIEILYIGHNNIAMEPKLRSLIQGLPNLKELGISNMNVDTDFTDMSWVPRTVTKLYCSYCDLNTENLMSLPDGLKTIDITGNPKVLDLSWIRGQPISKLER